MANVFLKVNKDLFKLGLNPTEILILAQIIEFNNNTGSCFISDKVLAENFGVSEKTISRTIKALEEKGYITRETSNVKGGKVRYMRVNQAKLAPTTDKMTVEENNNGQNVCCSKDKLSVDNGQNDLIKDNIKDNSLKDNLEFAAKAANSTINYPVVTVSQLVTMGIDYELIEDSKDLIRIKQTNKIVRVV